MVMAESLWVLYLPALSIHDMYHADHTHLLGKKLERELEQLTLHSLVAFSVYIWLLMISHSPVQSPQSRFCSYPSEMVVLIRVLPVFKAMHTVVVGTYEQRKEYSQDSYNYVD